MDFFEQQEDARKQTRRLIVLFTLAVIVIVVTVNLAVGLAWVIAFHRHVADGAGFFAMLPHGFFLLTTAATLLLILGGAASEYWNLREGGDAVAQMAGGRLLSGDSTDPLERRLLNVVEEMALASGIACPKTYVLDQEMAINAFAAGFSPNEAVVAVTRGTLERLSRDELQGVVGHEFSHILNGDMRLNLRVMGVLHGILLLALIGEQILSMLRFASWGDRRRDDKDGPSNGGIVLAGIVVGLSFWAVGYIGVFFGRIIKSAVSRQREFLADAAAVQFTRNPDSIGGALRKIGGLTSDSALGSEVLNANAERISHFFLGAARANLADGWLATHPPLAVRIQHIYGRDMPLISPSVQSSTEALATEAKPQRAPAGAGGLPGLGSAMGAFGALGSAGPVGGIGGAGAAAVILPGVVAASAAGMVSASALPPTNPIPDLLRMAAREPAGASALVIALVTAEDGAEQAKQRADVAAVAPEIDGARVIALATAFHALTPGLRVPMLDLAMPALKQLDADARARLLRGLDAAIKSDGRVTLSEFVTQTIVVRRLGQNAGRATPMRFANLQAARDSVLVALRLVAHVCARGAPAGDAARLESEAFARGMAMLQAGAGFEAAVTQQDATLTFAKVQAALDQLNQLAPLQKPMLMKVLAAATPQPPLSPELIDIMRGIGAAIEVPMPGNFAFVPG